MQRLDKRVDVRDREDVKAQVGAPSRALEMLSAHSLHLSLFLLQATLHRVLRHLVRHRHRLAAIQDALARDRAAAAASERKLGQALSVQPTIVMSYKQTKLQQHQLASTIDNFAPQVQWECLLHICSLRLQLTSVSHAPLQEGEVHAAAVAASAAAAHVADSDLKRAERIDAQAGLALDYMQRHAE